MFSPNDLPDLLEQAYIAYGTNQEFGKEEIRQIGVLLTRLMRYKPEARISAAEALEDEWFRDVDETFCLLPTGESDEKTTESSV